MKVLYLTDNRENYALGNFYEDWMHAFKLEFPDIVFFGPGKDSSMDQVDGKNFDLVVYGHAFADYIFEQMSTGTGELVFNGLELSKLAKIPSILFSKNEYKYMQERIKFMQKLDSCLFVVYTKKSLELYEKDYANIFWVPFGVNREKFFDQGQQRTIDISMRGNRHGDYIGKLRSGVADQITAKLPFLDLDVILSENGEDFIVGDAYINWLNRSKFNANTKSAMDIVNPKFAEAIACGCLPLCPVDKYEGLLIKNKHYVDIQDVLKLKSKVDFTKLYEDKKAAMASHLKTFIDAHDYSALLKLVIAKQQGSVKSNSAITDRTPFFALSKFFS